MFIVLIRILGYADSPLLLIVPKTTILHTNSFYAVQSASHKRRLLYYYALFQSTSSKAQTHLTAVAYRHPSVHASEVVDFVVAVAASGRLAAAALAFASEVVPSVMAAGAAAVAVGAVAGADVHRDKTVVKLFLVHWLV